MPPKNICHQRFVIPLSGEAWVKENKGRTPIHEKGIIFNSQDGEEDQYIAQTHDHFCLGEFAKSPGDYSLDIVWEFYRNMEGRRSDFSMVRGRRIDFSPEMINKLYHLEPVDDRQTLAFFDKPQKFLDEVEKELCYFGADWEYDVYGEKGCFRGRNLRYRTRPLLAFLSSRLIPVSNKTDIYLNRLTLLYAICSRMPINVGNIINAHIKMCRYDLTVSSLWFPSTITKLIKNAGINPNPNFMTPSHKMINKHFWAKCGPTIGPRKREGEVEELLRNRRNETFVSPGMMKHMMESFTEKFESVERKLDGMKSEMQDMKNDVNELKNELKKSNAEIREMKNANVKVDGMEARLMWKLHKIEHIQMQHVIYDSTMIWQFANYVQRMAYYVGYTETIQFLPFLFVDPSSCPIPNFNPVHEWQEMAQQPPPPPPTENPPPPNPPPQEPITSDKGSGTFSNLVDFAALFEIPNITTNVERSRSAESDLDSERAKRRKIEKGKQVVEKGDELSDGWRLVPITQPSYAWFGEEDIGGSGRNS